MVLKILFSFSFFFCQKAQNFVKFGPYDFVRISLTCGINILKGMYRDFRLPMSAFATAVGKNFDEKFTVKIDFPIE